MPVYTFKRPSDGAITKKKMTFDEYDLVKAGHYDIVDDAGEKLEIVFNPGSIGFVLQDGPSGGWASKALREKKYREARNGVMARREKDHVFKTRLIPNYQGMEAPSWKEAQEEARSKQGNAVASTYEPLVAKEKQVS